MMSIHEAVKHSCEFCEFKASTKGTLVRHAKSIHDGFKHYCEFCDSQYKITLKDM